MFQVDIFLSILGGVLSTLSCIIIIVSYFFFSRRDSLRLRLILSLTLSGMFLKDWLALYLVGSLTLYSVKRFLIHQDLLTAVNSIVTRCLDIEHKLVVGRLCSFNGIVWQTAIQAGDLSICLIAIITYCSIRDPLKWLNITTFWQRKEVFLFLGIWIVPFINSLVILFTVGYIPVTGNWCWIPREPIWVRFVSTHIPRYMVIGIVFALYFRLYFNVRSAFRSHKEDFEIAGILSSQGNSVSIYIENSTNQETFQSELLPDSSYLGRSPADEQRLIKSMRLLTLYPIVYILLWLPGLINRIVEAFGLSIQVLIILQSSVQFEGLANCILYGFTESKKKEILERFCRI
ncbi:hypothetical protein K7432_009319 [Basidiobolus ranarum]|uniref:G-protein coupled receptors family 1 profile domain-containing protein n=1 Tax=Basidiobolus ranarum TaxID=34480 RepID=A0ABR2VY06_9FUNG